MESQILIVIPCYNEASRLPVDSYVHYLNNEEAVRLLFVNDGSSDQTLMVLEKLVENFPNKTEVLNLKNNVGKAEAIRAGILHVAHRKLDFVGYFDADLATPLEEVHHLHSRGTLLNAELIMGSRVNLFGSTNINRNVWRHYVGRIFATAICNFFNLSIYDTQCGAKLISTKVASQLFENVFISSWLFDIELILRMRKYISSESQLGDKICEIPLRSWDEKGASKVSWTYLFKLPFELYKLKSKYKKQ